MVELAETLSQTTDSVFVVAPAGYGKTHLIAASAAYCEGRQLVLTHTHAGTNAIRAKMSALGTSSRQYHVDTIASWCLRLGLAYRRTSGWKTERPDAAQWSDLYQAIAVLLDSAFIQRIVTASYTGLFVDEYQDCSVAQHRLILRLAELLPTRVLGDPLQGIFDFDGQDAVDWTRDVESSFRCAGRLSIAERWNRAGAPRLGAWLFGVRQLLEGGSPVDLRRNRPPEVRLRLAPMDDGRFFLCQRNTCKFHNADQAETLIAIHRGKDEFKSKCHALAKNLSGSYSSIEEVEGKAVFSELQRIECARQPATKLRRAINFAKKCMSGVGAQLSNGTARGETVSVGKNTKSPNCVCAANRFLASPSSDRLATFLLSVRSIDGVSLYRADLFNRVIAILRKHALKPDYSLMEAAEEYQREFRYKGRPVGHKKQIGTTLLVKGLQFDHAIVLDAASLPKKDLYVALTRGAKSLTVVSTVPVLHPEA